MAKKAINDFLIIYPILILNYKNYINKIMKNFKLNLI